MKTDLKLYPSPKHARGSNYITFSIAPIIRDDMFMIVRDVEIKLYDKLVEDLQIYEIRFEVSLN